MSKKVQAEMLRQLAEALNRMTAEAVAQGLDVQMELNPHADSVYVHVEQDEEAHHE